MTDASPDHPEPVPPPGAPQPPPGAPAPPPGAPQPAPGVPAPPPGVPAPPPGAPTPNTPPPERAAPTPPPGTPPSVTGGGAIPSHPLPDTPVPPADSPAPPTESFPSSGAEFGQPIPAPGAPSQPGESPEARPAFGAPPPGAPGAEVAAPPKKKTWLWILLGFFAFALLGIGGCSFLLFRAASAPVNASNDFMALVSEDRGNEAYDQLAPLCQTNDRAAFEQLVNDVNPDSYNLNSVSVNSSGDNTAVVEGTVTIGGSAQGARFDLQEIDGDWRVCQFILGPTIYAGR